MDIVLNVLGAITGVIAFVVAFLLATPALIQLGTLTNKPEETRRSGFHLFTFIETGQVKIIVRGERVIRMVMDTAGKRFKRTGDPGGSEYWEIVDATDGESESPLAGIHPAIQWWARYVFGLTGAVFTGLYPFQRVREYQLERTNLSREETAGADGSNLVLKVKNDYSDHYRGRIFLYPMHITGAETKDKIPLDIIGTARLRVSNAHKAAFGTDRWDHFIVNLVTGAINDKTKTLRVDDILTANDAESARMVNNAVKDGVTEDTHVAGIEIEGFDIAEINPNIPAEELAILRAEALAIQKGKATTIDGDARATALRAVNAANNSGGEHAVETMKAEALIRAAQAAGAGGGTVILMPSSSTATVDPTQTAILAELRKLNERK